jgi:MFS transporter, ACS family, glucarate transporter
MMAGMGTLSPGRPIAKPTRVRLGVLAFACTLSLITYLDRVCISQVQKDIQFDLRITAVGMGMVFGAFALGYALFEVPGGWMGDRWGARRVLTRIVVWWSVFTALTGTADWLLGWAPGFDATTPAVVILIVLVGVRFLFGCGEAGAYPNLTRVVNSWFPFRERGVAQGAIWMSARLGGAVSFLTIELLTSWLGWRMAFCVLGLVGAAWCVAFVRWFRNTPQEKPQCNEAERDLIRGDAGAASAAGNAHGWPPWRPLASSLSLWALCVSAFGVSFGWYFFPTYQPKYLEDVHHLSADPGERAQAGARTVGLLAAPQGEGPLLAAAALAPTPPVHRLNLWAAFAAGLPFACGAVGCLVGGRLSDRLVRALGSRRWGRSLVGLGGFAGAGLCVLGTGFVAEAWQAVGLLCLAFLINDLAIPVIWAASADVGGRFVGTVAGIMNMVGALGAFLGIFLTPWVMDKLPTTFDAADRWRLVFAGYAGCWFLAAAAWLFVNAGKPLFRE